MAKINRLINRDRNKENKVEAKFAITELTKQELEIQSINFNYDEYKINEEDKNRLIAYEKEMIFQGKKLGEVAFNIGKTLIEVKRVFQNYNQEIGFMEWYKTLGLNKDQVYIYMGRYNLGLENPSAKDRIISLSDRTIKETIHKKTPQEIKEKVINGEITTGKQIKEARLNIISSMLEIENNQLIETEEEKRLKKELKLINQEIVEYKKKEREIQIKLKELLSKKSHILMILK